MFFMLGQLFSEQGQHAQLKYKGHTMTKNKKAYLE